MTNNLGFTLIELLVVVLIIAILGAMALPKYMVARDKAHLSGLMTIGKNVNDAMDRRSLFDSQDDTTALDLLDITFQKYDGSGDCTSGNCRIKASGKEYNLQPSMNEGGVQGKHRTIFYSFTNPSFGVFSVYTKEYDSSNRYRLSCYSPGGSYISAADLDEDRCVKIGLSLGATNPTQCDKDYTNPYCYWN